MDNDDDSEEMLQYTLKLARITRKRIIERGEGDIAEKDPLSRISERMLYAAALDQEKAEDLWGDRAAIDEDQFTSGSIKWILEPDIEQATMLVIGMQMAMAEPPQIAKLLRELGLDGNPYNEFALDQLIHLTEHQIKLKNEVDKANPLSAEEMLKAADDLINGSLENPSI